MRKLPVVLIATIGGMLASPTAAFAQSPFHGQTTYTQTTSTGQRECAGVTPLDTATPVTLVVTLTTRTWTTPVSPATGSVSFAVTRGVATVTAPDGLSDSYLLHYRSSQQIGGPTFVIGRDLLGGGAMSDMVYLEGGSATVADDGAAGITSGQWIDVCAALGA